MSDSSPASETVQTEPVQTESIPTEPTPTAPIASEPQPSYVKLAMRNMVKKRRTSMFHFVLTLVGLLTVLVGLSYLTR